MIRFSDIKPELDWLRRRGLLRGSLSLGGLALLTGCDLSTHSGVDAALWAMLRFNDRIQAMLFSPSRMAGTYPASAITKPFRFNAYYPEWQVRSIDPADWHLDVAGLVSDKTPWTVERLRALPQEGQITRHICIEGWSQVVQWSGVPLLQGYGRRQDIEHDGLGPDERLTIIVTTGRRASGRSSLH